jgi:hypothetical protein
MAYKLTRFGTLIDGVAGTAAAANRTATIQVHGLDANRKRQLNGTRLRWTASLTYVAATTFTIDVYASVDGGTTYGFVQSQAVSGGIATLSDYIQTKDPAAADVAMDGWMDCVGATHVRLILANGGAADVMSLIAALTEDPR